MTRTSSAVFLSYASEDAPAAQRLCEALRAAGVEVWFDRNELRGGEAWDRRIRKQIHDCGLLIAVVSAHSNAREEGYFRREWRLAIERTLDLADDTPFLLPVTIDDTTETKARVPDGFRSVQWTHLPAGEVSPGFIDQVLRLLSPDQAQTGTPPVQHAAVARVSRARSATVRRTSVGIAAAGILFAGAIGFWLVHGHQKPPPNERASPVARAAPNVTAATASQQKSIAVLPFVDMSEKRDQEYFSDGLTEELIDHLAHAPDLKVTSRTSSFQFKGKNEDLRSIAQKLGVAHVLEGSVRKSGKEVRITAQLIRTTDDTHLWSQTYDRALKDIFKLQDEIATTVTTALQVAMSPVPSSRARTTTNMEAYSLLLKGNYYFVRGNSGDSTAAIAQYLQALKLEPNYALAWAKLARTYMGQALWGEVPPTAVADKARQAAQRAVAIDPDSAAAHYALGMVHFYYDYDWKAARADFERSITLDPHGEDSNDARENIADLAATKTGEEPIELYKQHLAEDPLNTLTLFSLGEVLRFAGRFESSAATSRRLLAINPDFALAHQQLALSLLLMGKPTDALASAQLESDEASKLVTLACVHWSLGHQRESAQAMGAVEAKYAQSTAYFIAAAHAWRGETDAAFAWLDRAYRQRDSNLVFVKREIFLKSVRADPRFHALLLRMNLAD